MVHCACYEESERAEYKKGTKNRSNLHVNIETRHVAGVDLNLACITIQGYVGQLSHLTRADNATRLVKCKLVASIPNRAAVLVLVKAESIVGPSYNTSRIYTSSHGPYSRTFQFAPRRMP